MINDALKGHLMKKGTLMILQRMLATALGALGLGALVSGPAFGQAPGSSNIPAPDVFDDQITCTQLLPTVSGFNLPSSVPRGGIASPLDDIIGMGTNLLEAGDTVFDAVADAPAKLAGLGYVIPPTNMNCGAGATGPTLGTMNIDGNTDGDFLDVGDTLAWGSVPKDVADGYSDLLTKYVAVYGDPGGTTGGTLRALEAAQKLLDETDSSLTALVEARARSRDAAQEAHNKALGAFNAASTGPIYQAGVAEWRAKAAVSQAIVDYNTQVTKTNEAQAAVDAMQYSEWNVGDEAANFAVTQGNSKYVPLANTSLVGTVVTIANGMGTVVLGALETYTGGTTAAPVAGTPAMAATGVGTLTAMAATDSSSANSNFTTLGELIVPMTATDLDNDGASFNEALIPTVSANGAGTNDVTTIRTTVMNVRIAAAALKKARDENTNPRFQDLYDEAYRRANLEQEYYDALWARVLADNTDTRTAQQRLRYLDTNDNGINEVGEQTTANLNTAYEANPITIASRNAAYNTESGNRMGEETSLRTLVAAREMATAGVVAQFTNAQAFYQQLVDRRQALKNAADMVVADTTNPSAAQTKAAADAATALTMAQTEKAKIDALFPEGEGNPVVGLVSELLKTGGDDGQALVDAISSTYADTQVNKDEIEDLTEKVNMLTGDDGQGGNVQELTTRVDGLLTTADDGTQSGLVADNSNDIDTLEGRADALLTTADDGTESGRIVDIEGDVTTINDILGVTAPQDDDPMSGCGGTGLINIANCADARSQHNADTIQGLTADDGAIAMGDNAVRGEFAAADAALAGEGRTTETIKGNADAIAANAGNIMTNVGNIAMNSGYIMTNTGNIEANAGNIMNNAEMIGMNAGAIMMNAGGISTNASAISVNRQMIDRNMQDIDMLRSGVAASMALAGLPEIGDRGVSVGAGSFDGESAIAVGVHFSGENSRFRLGVSSSGGETGASIGAGWSF